MARDDYNGGRNQGRNGAGPRQNSRGPVNNNRNAGGQGYNGPQRYNGQGYNGPQGYNGQGYNGPQGYNGQGYNRGGSRPQGRNGAPQRNRQPVRGDSRPRTPSGRKKGGKKKGGTIAIIILELIIIAICGFGAYWLFFRTDVTKITEVNMNSDAVEENIADSVKENAQMKGYWNIALFGVDARDDLLDSGTRTDTIIIASIDRETGNVKLCSVYRDTYLNLCSESGDKYSKCNEAYAYGGPEQALNMLNKNLDMDIKDFVTIGFGGLTELINDIGGVEISVEENEIEHLNNYQSTMAQSMGIKYTEVKSAGVQTLDGLQATAYCRIRYTAGDDFARAARQREVIQAILDKAVTLDKNTLVDAANNIFDKKMATSLRLTDIVDLLGNVGHYNIVAEDGFPQESMRATGKVGGKSVIAPISLESNVEWLHGFLFGDEGYEVSQSVKDYSGVISSKTSGLAH
ncbi:LCP family protein [Butyrivibrio sp. MC2013]|uniref:LCP family protein n=1 Tax=Butyrivibrio sp. MC2013 TaxID=1280686 RepID=UPI00040B6D42|nr:LCP family protein [Butyrivibrio sp. MC2013]